MSPFPLVVEMFHFAHFSPLDERGRPRPEWDVVREKILITTFRDRFGRLPDRAEYRRWAAETRDM